MRVHVQVPYPYHQPAEKSIPFATQGYRDGRAVSREHCERVSLFSQTELRPPIHPACPLNGLRQV
jgi:hypothetical protein